MKKLITLTWNWFFNRQEFSLLLELRKWIAFLSARSLRSSWNSSKHGFLTAGILSVYFP